ncbi:MTRF1L release factor glutamine methyltransferase isoform X2 [Microcebus murinus]|uniref:MTRF1L release factor glutamine methyltransferase isoform X2 n=1 Tax=Microcebus murinus TaxID=30608 RepID=UPI003F6B2870
MELWGRMLWTLLSGPGRRGGTWGWAFSSWQPHSPLAGLSSATELVRHWTGVFEKRGIPEARESSEYIVAHVLGAKTELVEWVLEEVARRSHTVGVQGSPLILEVGCGSGAISLSLLSELPQSRVIAVDKEAAAISLTRENAQRLQLQDRIWIVPLDVTLEGSWTHLLPWGPVDLVISNPPYVFHQDMEQLAPEIRSYEDPEALDGGEEGMDVITHILTLAPQLLKDFGSIYLEVDPRHPELVSSWLQSHPDLYLHLVAVRRDFCGRPRFLHIQQSGP